MKAIFRWKNSRNLIYEEQTGNIIPILSLKRPHSRVLHISLIAVLLSFMNWFHLYSLSKSGCNFNNTICKSTH